MDYIKALIFKPGFFHHEEHEAHKEISQKSQVKSQKKKSNHELTRICTNLFLPQSTPRSQRNFRQDNRIDLIIFTPEHTLRQAQDRQRAQGNFRHRLTLI